MFGLMQNFNAIFYTFPFDNADLSTGALTGSLGLSWFPKADLQIQQMHPLGLEHPTLTTLAKFSILNLGQL